jgi:hypothetical protein
MPRPGIDTVGIRRVDRAPVQVRARHHILPACPTILADQESTMLDANDDPFRAFRSNGNAMQVPRVKRSVEERPSLAALDVVDTR